jgi:hypothetical protein
MSSLKQRTTKNVCLIYPVVYKDFCESLKECTSIEAADRLTVKFGEINTLKTRKLLVQDIVEF